MSRWDMFPSYFRLASRLVKKMFGENPTIQNGTSPVVCLLRCFFYGFFVPWDSSNHPPFGEDFCDFFRTTKQANLRLICGYPWFFKNAMTRRQNIFHSWLSDWTPSTSRVNDADFRWMDFLFYPKYPDPSKHPLFWGPRTLLDRLKKTFHWGTLQSPIADS